MAKIEYKAGQRVALRAEGVVAEDYASASDGDTIQIETDHGYIYVEVGTSLRPFIEVIKEPLKEGLYYYGNADKPVDQFSQVYKLAGGVWYDTLLGAVDLSEDEIDLMVPLVRGGN